MPLNAKGTLNGTINIRYNCNHKLVMQGDNQSNCDPETGIWTPKEMPKCVCPSPPTPKHPLQVNKIGDEITLKCKEKFQFESRDNDEYVTCNLTTGDWFPPKCVCVPPDPSTADFIIPNATLEKVDGFTMKYVCNSGFKQAGELILRCTEGDWKKDNVSAICEFNLRVVQIKFTVLHAAVSL